VNYSELPYLVLEGVRELKAQNDDLAGQVRKAHAELAKLSRAAAEKDAQLQSLSRQVEELRQAQEQMMEVVARLAHQQAGETHVARAASAGHTAAKTRKPARSEIARVQF